MPPDLRKKAERLFVNAGVPLSSIAGQLTISLPTLKSWSAKFSWKAKQEVEEKLSALLPQLMLKLALDIENTADPQSVAQLTNALSGFIKSTKGVPKPEKEAAPGEKQPLDKGLTPQQAALLRNLKGSDEKEE